MDEFLNRRKKLAAQMQNSSIAIIVGAKEILRNGDAHYAFRQSSDFYYLTGFNEPDSIMALTKDSKGDVNFILFNRPNNPHEEVWNGKRAGLEGACKDHHADAAFDVATINEEMPRLFADKHIIYYAIGAAKTVDKMIVQWLSAAKSLVAGKAYSQQQGVLFVPNTFTDLTPILNELRLIKSDQEIEYMRKAAEISGRAHFKLMQTCKTVQMEYQLEAIFNEYCLQNGCRGFAYTAIVAGGNNGCTLHYVTNDQALQNGELVLVDAGGEYNNYAADITRTFPINGKFTPAQRQIYQLVLDAQLAGIEQVKPGNTYDRVENAIVEVLISGLLKLGLLTGEKQQLIKDRAFKKYYMHSSGHWLGLDVHDVGNYKVDGKWRKFEPGMVLTVEPGIYIANTLTDVDAKWLGIGVRIEDDILVTKHGHEVLSNTAPKTIDEIESAAL